MAYSVIIPTLWKCNLENFYNTLRIFSGEPQIKEIILIDNDITFKQTIKSNILNLSPKIKYCPQDENIYVNPAWNLGESEARGEHLIIVNDDFHITSKKILKNIIKTHQDNKDIYTSIYGISTSCYIEEPTSNKIYLTDNEGRGTGWGCFFILHRYTWTDIPNELKIWFGDDYLTKHVLSNGGKVYTFKNIKASPFSQTLSSPTFNSILDNDTKIYMEKYDI